MIMAKGNIIFVYLRIQSISCPEIEKRKRVGYRSDFSPLGMRTPAFGANNHPSMGINIRQ